MCSVDICFGIRLRCADKHLTRFIVKYNKYTFGEYGTKDLDTNCLFCNDIYQSTIQYIWMYQRVERR